VAAVPGSDIEVIRRGFELFNHGDIEGMLALTADDVEVFIQEDLPNGGHWDGVGGFREAVRTWNEAWDEFTAEPLDFEEGSGSVLIRVRQRVRTGELALEEDFFYVMGTAGGKLVLWHLYNDEARARKAAGLGG
jgi:ketosteroid isomerase-like protein